jgi:formate dehydrogenase maturation protein FdhE
MRVRPRCPFCGSPEVAVLAPWGGQLITTQLQCRTCNSYFEAVREAFDPEVVDPGTERSE